ncbi:transposase [Saccharothrix lopnurensis]|uniref:Transposase n=1 Tax=Saccharothrix lopnurensis TaxID=1670621 RepID=A0ABW1PB66_9PSEU
MVTPWPAKRTTFPVPPRKYSSELRERAVHMVFELRDQGERTGMIARVADQFGVHGEALRTWVRQAEVDGGKRPGTSTGDARRIAEFERENRELRRANEILKAASAYFARELDPKPPSWSGSSTPTAHSSAWSRSVPCWSCRRPRIGRSRSGSRFRRLVRSGMNG